MRERIRVQLSYVIVLDGGATLKSDCWSDIYGLIAEGLKPKCLVPDTGTVDIEGGAHISITYPREKKSRKAAEGKR